MSKPIKRHESLQQVSREHHYGLLMSWKIREGLKRKVDPSRIKKFIDWFYEKYQKAHFDIEEKYIYPVLNNDDPMIIQAIEEHRYIESLFREKDQIEDALIALEKAMDNHIRFEERILFNKVQKIATEEQLKLIEENHNTPFEDDWEDQFWKSPKA